MVIAVQTEFHRGFFELQSSGDEGRIVQELRLATLEWCVSAPLSDAGHDASGVWTAREFCLVAQWQSLRFVRTLEQHVAHFNVHYSTSVSGKPHSSSNSPRNASL